MVASYVTSLGDDYMTFFAILQIIHSDYFHIYYMQCFKNELVIESLGLQHIVKTENVYSLNGIYLSFVELVSKFRVFGTFLSLHLEIIIASTYKNPYTVHKYKSFSRTFISLPSSTKMSYVINLFTKSIANSYFPTILGQEKNNRLLLYVKAILWYKYVQCL